MFAFLHHEKPVEESHNVMERVAYVKREKPKREVWIRLHNMMYLDPALCAAGEFAQVRALLRHARARLGGELNDGFAPQAGLTWLRFVIF